MLVNYSILIIIILYIVSFFLKGTFPAKSGIEQELYKDPIQSKIEKKEFSFGYAGEEYVVRELAGYEIWGLVVSHNNIKGYMDIVHDKNSVDLKDLCLIRGSNIEGEIYNDVKFKNKMFTCFATWKKGVKVNMKEISNNHLITDDDEMQKLIRTVNVGDQVHIKGKLVSYKNNKCDYGSHCRRSSSLTRSDTGDHACEVIFVEKIEILKKGTVFWYLINKTGIWIIVILFFSKIYLIGEVTKNDTSKKRKALNEQS